MLGIAGTRYARFSQFFRSPKRILFYAGDVIRHKEPRHVGHNTLVAGMILMLLTMVGGRDADDGCRMGRQVGGRG